VSPSEPAAGPEAPSAWRAADPWLGLAARVAVGLVFVVSGTFKAAAPAEEFALVIQAFQVVPSADFIQGLATFLPWVEVLLGFALVLGWRTRAAAAAIGGLILVFVGVILSTKVRGIDLPNCGCFGFGFHPSPTQELGLNALWSVCVTQAWRRGADRLSLDGWCLSAEDRRPNKPVLRRAPAASPDAAA